jgi:glycosyltransferase involved in cell wall biosynthesis
MRILQLIDTLHPGGAEHMAVNYANGLLKPSFESYICVTREEGILRNKLKSGVQYHFLQKERTLDIAAFFKLRKLLKNHKIQIVHAHGSSWFFAVLCKISGLNFKLIWHDHYGQSEFLNERKLQPLKFFSNYFNGIICVNKKLKEWAVKYLNCNKVVFLNNFIAHEEFKDIPPVALKGKAEYNLICVANLRPQKDHLSLLKMLKIVGTTNHVALHLIGKSFDNSFSKKLLKEFEKNSNVYYYGEQEEISSLLRQADIGILSSHSEGLPLVLFDYGMASLPVVCTKVGHCEEVLAENGVLVSPGEPELLAKAVNSYLINRELRKQHGKGLMDRVKQRYQEESVIPQYLKFCSKL